MNGARRVSERRLPCKWTRLVIVTVAMDEFTSYLSVIQVLPIPIPLTSPLPILFPIPISTEHVGEVAAMLVVD